MGFNCLNAAEPLRADNLVLTFEPIQDGGGAQKSLCQVSTASSTNVAISPQNFLTFSFNPFATLV